MSAIDVARREVQRRIADLTRAFDDVVATSAADAADDEHDPDGSGGVAYERQQVAALLQAARAELAALTAAQARVADGTYGTCAACGRAIAEERLEAMPSATTCVGCAL